MSDKIPAFPYDRFDGKQPLESYKRNLIPWLKNYGVLDYVRGTMKRPNETDTNKDDLTNWDKADARALLMLNSTFTVDVQMRIAHMLDVDYNDTSNQVWNAILTNYAPKAGDVIDIMKQLGLRKQRNGEKVADFHREIIELLRQLGIARGKPYTFDEEFTYVATNIGIQFDGTIEHLKNIVKELDSSSLRARLVERERTLETRMAENDITKSFATKTGKPWKYNGSFDKSKGGKKCYHCKKIGHIEADCWTLHPEKRQKGRGSNNSHSKQNEKIPTSNVTGVFSFVSVSESAATAAAVQSTEHDKSFYWDSGTNRHICNDPNMVHNMRPSDGPQYVKAGSSLAKIEGMGEVYLPLLNPKTNSVSTNMLELKNTLVVPTFMLNLVSNQVFDRGNCRLEGGDGKVRMYSSKNELIFWAELTESENLYQMVTGPPVRVTDEIALTQLGVVDTAKYVDPMALYHNRFAHLGEEATAKTINGGHVRGVDSNIKLNSTKGICEGCAKGRQTRLTLPNTADEMNKAQSPMDRWHADLIILNEGGPYTCALIITDEYSRFTMFAPLHQKSDTFKAYKDLQLMMENKLGRKLKEAQSDQGGEFNNHATEEWFNECGVKQLKSVAESHEQNGLAERHNCTLIEKARSVLAAANLPKKLWAEAMRYAAVTHNRSWNAKQGKTPWEAFFGEKPDISNMRIFGCDIWVHIEKSRRRKFDNKSKLYKMIGYGTAEGMKAYKLWDPEMSEAKYYGQMFKWADARSTKFDEAKFIKQAIGM